MTFRQFVTQIKTIKTWVYARNSPVPVLRHIVATRVMTATRVNMRVRRACACYGCSNTLPRSPPVVCHSMQSETWRYGLPLRDVTGLAVCAHPALVHAPETCGADGNVRTPTAQVPEMLEVAPTVAVSSYP